MNRKNYISLNQESVKNIGKILFKKHFFRDEKENIL